MRNKGQTTYPIFVMIYDTHSESDNGAVVAASDEREAKSILEKHFGVGNVYHDVINTLNEATRKGILYTSDIKKKMLEGKELSDIVNLKL